MGLVFKWPYRKGLKLFVIDDREFQDSQSLRPLFSVCTGCVPGSFHAISGDTNNSGEMNKCWWTSKGS